MDQIDDKYIVEAKMIPKAESIEKSRITGFLSGAVSVAAAVIIFGAIILWSLVGKDLLSKKQGDDTSTPPDVTTESVPPDTTPTPKYSEGLAFEVYDDYCIMVGIGSCTDVNVIIPPTYKGKEVRYVRDYEGFENVKTLVIPDTVKGYGQGSLKTCISLEEITLPILCPPNHRFIGLFKTSTSDPGDMPNLKKVTLTRQTKIGTEAFVEMYSLESIILPDTVTSIEYGAFSGCSSLKTLTIPEGVTSIDFGITIGCTSMETVYLPSSLEKINLSMLAGCPSNVKVYYAGTMKQWHLLNMGRWGTPEITVICSDGVWKYSG
jgi:hypothetical protein